MEQPLGTDAFQCTDSIAQCGHTYAVVNGINPGIEVLFRNEGQRTWLRNSTDCSDREYLLYDFSLDVGDTTYIGWQMEGPTLDTTLAVVQAIDAVLYNEVLRRRFTLLIDRCPDIFGPTLFTMDEWVEGIGSVRHPFYSAICICDFCETGLALQCADSAGVSIYRATPAASCERTLDIADRSTNNYTFQVSYAENALYPIYPDTYTGGTMLMYDMNGREVLRTGTMDRPSSISVGMLSAGTYTIILRSEVRRWATLCVLIP